MSLGDKLKQRREEMGLNQDELAEKLDQEVTRQAISKWERNEAYPKIENLLALSVVLDISLDDLFADDLAYQRRKMKIADSSLDMYPGLTKGIQTVIDAIEQVTKG